MIKIILSLFALFTFACSFQEKKNVSDIFNSDFQITYQDIENEGFNLFQTEVWFQVLDLKPFGYCAKCYCRAGE